MLLKRKFKVGFGCGKKKVKILLLGFESGVVVGVFVDGIIFVV